MRKTKMVLKLATYKKLFFVGLFSFFFQQKALSQTYGMDLVTNQKSQCQPALFKWVVQKAPSGSVFLWDYGSGIYQGSDTFYALIKPSGKISVKVAVKMPSGKNAILSKIDFVEVYAKPEPKLYASRKILCDGPDSATYFDITPNGAKRSWVIDGTNYNNASKKQTHYYASTGVKKLSMVVEDANGCRTIKEYDSIAIIHKDVIIDFAADKLTGCVPQTIKFTPTINNNGLKILSYQWLFNGGQPFKQLKEVPDSVKYSAAGKFSVSLEVKAENGCVHKFEKQDYLAFGSIDSISLKISDTSVCVGKTITIENLNKNLAGNFKWTLKGTTSIAQPDKYTCNARYDTLGKFDIEVTYTYNGCEVSKILKKIIRVKGVAAEFSSKDYYHCQMPHSVHLENLSKSFESGKMYYKWMVFDNSKLVFISAKLNDSFQVKKTGEYDVMLVTTHSNGCVDTFTQKKYIRNTPIKPNFEALFTVGCIGQKIEFLQKTPRSSYLSPDRFVWTFYDKDTTKILDTSTFTGPQFKYSDTGFYNVKMVAYNTIGCKDSIVKRNYIEIVNPRINFELAKPVICKKEVLIAKGRSYPRHVKFNYSWRFKNNIDNSIIYSSDSVYKDTIRKSGEYTLKFFHTINAGCKDSIIKNDLIKVNGISGTMSLDTFNGCSPLVVSPYLKLTENYHFGSGDSSINYKWNTISSNNFVIKNSTSPNPVFIFNDQGNYSINLLANNSVGCPFEAVSKIIHVGVFSDFDISDNVVCANQELTLTNRSFNHTAIKWLLNSNTITTNNLYDDKISVYFNKSGDQRIGLVAIKSNYCFDTIFKMVRSIIVKAELISPEPYLKCAPVYAQFISKSKNADSLKWDFGNGNFVITKDTLVANIYNKNSGSLKGYDITLIAKSNEGCSDTILKSGYIKVVGPIPSFELYNFTGCEPLNVKFKNTSTDVFKHFLNFSDGSPLDSAFGNHIYRVVNTGLNFQEYIPRMYALDSMGCKAEFESKNVIKVKKSPIANFTITDTLVCENKTIAYIDKATNVTSSTFYLKAGNGAKYPANGGSFSIPEKGNYELIQIVENSNNCMDSLKFKIHVNPNPVANFKLMDTLCFAKVHNFKNLSTGDNPLVDYDWKIDNSTDSVFYKTQDIQHTFDKYGFSSVRLIVKDSNNCKNTLTQILNTPNPADIPPGELKVVSVNTDSSVNIISNPTNYSRFLYGNFYNSNSGELINTATTKKEIQFNYYNTYTSDSSACFDFKTVDVCGYESSLGIKHCTILLNVTSNKLFTNQLNWSHYIGWPSIDKYSVYRKKEGEVTFYKIKDLTPNHTSYLDSAICDFNYTYYVAASFNNSISNSNRVNRRPLFEYPPAFKDIKNVSVTADNSIEVKWLKSRNLNFNNYLLYKNDVLTNYWEAIPLENNSFMDIKVQTANNNYVYRVLETDKCGNRGKTDFEGKNIVLTARSADYTTALFWNTYKSWRAGVKIYNLQVEKEGIFKTIYSASPTDSSFSHNQVTENIHGPYCYRIMAVSGDDNDTSFSNIACVISPSLLLFPNAFSPNGDGVNEKIGVRSLFVYNKTKFTGKNFSLEIYNRWGEKVFESHDIDDEWDGKYLGKPVQQGAYLYQLKASGVDKRSYSLKGTITILP